MTSHFKTISTPSEGLYKEKGSKFIAHAFPIREPSQLTKHLQLLKKNHPKARHLCFAYRLGTEGTQFRSSDDGEPSGTAGKPILGQIDAFGITNVLVIVVRYFGGTLLGASGLARAYREAARACLSNGQQIKVEIRDKWSVTFTYQIMGSLLHEVSKLPIEVLEKSLDPPPKILITTPVLQSDNILDTLLARTLKISVEEVGGSRNFEQINISPK